MTIDVTGKAGSGPDGMEPSEPLARKSGGEEDASFSYCPVTKSARRGNPRPLVLIPVDGVLPPSRLLKVLDGGDGWGFEIAPPYRPPETDTDFSEAEDAGEGADASGISPDNSESK